MKIIYRSKWLRNIFGTLFVVLGIALFYEKGLSVFDYENFDIIQIAFLVYMPKYLYDYFLSSKFDLTTDGIKIKKPEAITIPYDRISGVSYFNSYMNVKTKDDKSYRFPLFSIENNDEIKKFLLKEKQIPKLSAWSSFSIQMIVYYGLLMLISLMLICKMTGKGNEFKSMLPLLPVEVDEIEGRLSKDTKIRIYVHEERGVFNVFAKLALVEFPEVVFKYPYREKNLRNKVLFYENHETKIETGTEVKIKIRTKDYKNLMSSKANGFKHSNIKEKITFYSLELDDMVVLEKEHLKEN